MSFLLLGLDSLIACLAIGPIVAPRSRLALAALFGLADGGGFLVGSAVGWQLPSQASAVLATATMAGLGLYLVVIAGVTRRVAPRWPVWVLPCALTLDNLAYGLVGDHSAGRLLGQAGQQALSSALLALAGLLVAVVLPRVFPVMHRGAAASGVAGGALVLVAGVSMLAG